MLRGLLYLALVPLWQAPDEPAHYEYAWLLGHQGIARTWLNPDELDRDAQAHIQRQIIASLDHADFWTRTRQTRPIPLPQTFAQNPFLLRSGSQIGRSPLPYLIPALITHLDGLSLDTQAYLMRAYSLGVWLLTVALAWMGASSLFMDLPSIVAITGFFALAPMPTFIGVSVNSDVPANLMSLASYVMLIRILQRKSSFTFSLLVLLLALASKRTTAFLLPTAGVAAVWLIQRMDAKMRHKLIWGTRLAVLLSVSLAFLMLLWRDPVAADWYQADPVRPAERSTLAHTGHYALTLHDESATERLLLTQAVPQAAIPALRSQTLQANAWVRAEKDPVLICLVLFDGIQRGKSCVMADQQWQILALPYTIAPAADRLRLLIGIGEPGDSEATGTVLVDDISLSLNGSKNLLLNGDAETGRRHGQDLLDAFDAGLQPWMSLAQNLSNPASYTPERWLTYITFVVLTFAGFWGNLGWLQLPMPVPVYGVLALICSLATVGLIRRRAWLPDEQKRIWQILAVSLFFLAVQTFLPMIAPASDPVRWQPQGRYLFPGLLPITIFLWLGCCAWVPAIQRRTLALIWCASLILLDLVALMIVVSYQWSVVS